MADAAAGADPRPARADTTPTSSVTPAIPRAGAARLQLGAPGGARHPAGTRFYEESTYWNPSWTLAAGRDPDDEHLRHGRDGAARSARARCCRRRPTRRRSAPTCWGSARRWRAARTCHTLDERVQLRARRRPEWGRGSCRIPCSAATPRWRRICRRSASRSRWRDLRRRELRRGGELPKPGARPSSNGSRRTWRPMSRCRRAPLPPAPPHRFEARRGWSPEGSWRRGRSGRHRGPTTRRSARIRSHCC